MALRLLSGRDYTRQALQHTLQQRGVSAAEAQTAVERLVQEGFLQDRRYAERFVAAVRESGKYTGYRLRQELRRRGFPVELIDEVLRGGLDEVDECNHARALVERRYTGFDPQTADAREVMRVTGFLQRRGYRGEIIRRVLGRSPSAYE